MDDSVEELEACSDRVQYLASVLFGHKLNLEMIDRESCTTECSCCGVDCYSDGSHTAWYREDGTSCRYSEV